jgi:hypothetical protein
MITFRRRPRQRPGGTGASAGAAPDDKGRTIMLAGFLAGLRQFWQQLAGPPKLTLRRQLIDYLGHDYRQLEKHEKSFPGYDVASLHRALDSFRDDCCQESHQVGSTPAAGLPYLFDLLESPYQHNLMPGAPIYQRVPVDVAQEGSFATNCLYLATLDPGVAGPAAEKIAILLATSATGRDYWDGMDTHNVPHQLINIGIAARSKEVANRFFHEIEERRKRLSVYRGKVIDPVVGGGGIHTIGFRAIRPVSAADLVLPEGVKALIDNAILGFYRHRDALRSLGIELKRGILFHSPPGTGKTSISLYLASQLPHFTVCFISGERLLYPREICRMARYLQPAMLVFEDIDLVAQERNANGLATVLGELMNQIDGCDPSDQVLFVMNTNSLERLEHAVKNRPGRVDQIIEIPLPDREQRRQLLGHFARTVRLELGGGEAVLEATDGATPAMLKEIVKRAVINAIERDGDEKRAGPLEVSEPDLLLAAEQVRALRDPEIVPGSFGFREKRL